MRCSYFSFVAAYLALLSYPASSASESDPSLPSLLADYDSKVNSTHLRLAAVGAAMANQSTAVDALFNSTEVEHKKVLAELEREVSDFLNATFLGERSAEEGAMTIEGQVVAGQARISDQARLLNSTLAALVENVTSIERQSDGVAANVSALSSQIPPSLSPRLSALRARVTAVHSNITSLEDAVVDIGGRGVSATSTYIEHYTGYSGCNVTVSTCDFGEEWRSPLACSREVDGRLVNISLCSNWTALSRPCGGCNLTLTQCEQCKEFGGGYECAVLDSIGPYFCQHSTGEGLPLAECPSSATSSIPVLASPICQLNTTVRYSNPGAATMFGIDSTISDDGRVIAAGSRMDTVDALSSAGAVYVYVLDNDTRQYVMSQRLVAPTPQQNANYGFRHQVCPLADCILVSATQHDVEGVLASGQVYLHVWNGTAFDFSLALTASDYSNGATFGDSLSVASDLSTFVVGSTGMQVEGKASAGAVYIFRSVNTTAYNETQKLVSPHATNSGEFGVSTALSRSAVWLVVGEHKGDSLRGRVHLFKWDGERYGYHQLLSSPGPYAEGAHFGVSVAVSDDGYYIAVGQYKATNEKGSESGSVAVYRRRGYGRHMLDSTLSSSDAVAGGRFGLSVALSSNGGVLIVGSQDMYSAAGMVYVFRRPSGSSTFVEHQAATVLGASSGDGLGNRVEVSSSGGVVVSGAQGYGTGSIFVFTFNYA